MTHLRRQFAFLPGSLFELNSSIGVFLEPPASLPPQGVRSLFFNSKGGGELIPHYGDKILIKQERKDEMADKD